MNVYTLRIDGGCEETIEAETLETARERAEAWARGGDWDTSTGTVYCDVRIYYDGDLVERVTVAVQPDEPRCPGHVKHDWQSPHEIVGGCAENPGVWGHGGGVVIHECCMQCGCRRKTDTWAQRRDTGEQGLREVTYQPGHYNKTEAAS